MSRDLFVAGYVAVVLAVVVLAATARREGTRLASLADVFGQLSARRFGRVAVGFGWWWLGWHFFVR
jgi:hypothetical protein